MKINAHQSLWFMLLTSLTLFVTTGCNDRQAIADADLKDFEAQAGMLFPTNAVLVGSDDGGGRGASVGFWQWSVYSPAQITMPPYGGSYDDFPLDTAVRYVEAKMRKLKVMQPQSAFLSQWQTNGYEFRGIIVRTPQGDYLAVERFRRN